LRFLAIDFGSIYPIYDFFKVFRSDFSRLHRHGKTVSVFLALLVAACASTHPAAPPSVKRDRCQRAAQAFLKQTSHGEPGWAVTYTEDAGECCYVKVATEIQWPADGEASACLTVDGKPAAERTCPPPCW
jgi:hypothetical protein